MEPTSIQYLKKISTLRQVVELGGLSQVAQHNKVTISAVSQTISGLEKSLDRTLFVRNGGRLIPTQHCLQLLESAAPAFRAIEAFAHTFEPPTEIPPIAWLDFGVSHCLASDLLPRLVKKLREAVPAIRLKLKTGRCQALADSVKKGKLCMALVAADEIPKGVSSYPVFEERLGLYSSSERDCELDSVLSGQFAGIGADTEGHPVYYRRFLRNLGITSAPALAADTYESLYDVAVSGILPALLPERLANRSKGLLREITPRKASDKLGHFEIYLVSQKTCDPAEDRFLLRELQSLL